MLKMLIVFYKMTCYVLKKGLKMIFNSDKVLQVMLAKHFKTLKLLSQLPLAMQNTLVRYWTQNYKLFVGKLIMCWHFLSVIYTIATLKYEVNHIFFMLDPYTSTVWARVTLKRLKVFSDVLPDLWSQIMII